MRKIYIVSDTHLEFRKDKQASQVNLIASDSADSFLALPGDIGNPFITAYYDFIERHSQRFKHVFVVSGNHEYYSSNKKQRTMKEIDEKLESIADAFPNVSFLQKKQILLDDILFMGCTLWSPADEMCEMLMNDYSEIY